MIPRCKWVQILVGLVVLWMLVSPVQAQTTFYVATDGSDDTGTGSQGSPWATISHAIQNVPDRHARQILTCRLSFAKRVATIVIGEQSAISGWWRQILPGLI